MIKNFKKMLYQNLFFYFQAKKFDLNIRQNCRKVDQHDIHSNVHKSKYWHKNEFDGGEFCQK